MHSHFLLSPTGSRKLALFWVLLTGWMGMTAQGQVQSADRLWTRRDGATVTGRLLDVREHLVTLNVGSTMADVPYLQLSDADKEVVNEWLRQQIAVPSSRHLRPTIKFSKRQGRRSGSAIQFYVNGVLQTTAITMVEAEVIVPTYYEAAKLTLSKVDSGYGKRLSNADIANMSNGKRLGLASLPKGPYLKVLEELELAYEMTARVLEWDANRTPNADSAARLGAIINADASMRKLGLIRDIQDGSRQKSSNYGTGLDIERTYSKSVSSDLWFPTIPRKANSIRIKLALTRLTQFLAVVSDANAAIEFRQLRWKALREELLVMVELFRLCCLPEHPWSLTVNPFSVSSEEVYLGLSEGSIVHASQRVKDR